MLSIAAGDRSQLRVWEKLARSPYIHACMQYRYMRQNASKMLSTMPTASIYGHPIAQRTFNVYNVCMYVCMYVCMSSMIGLGFTRSDEQDTNLTK